MTETEKLLATTTVPIAVAFIGYIATYANTLRLAKRAERLARVNKQLSELYGPLFAVVHSSERVWIEFRKKYKPGGPYFGSIPPPTNEEQEAWRLWIATVFMPQNLKIYECVLTKADLLIEPEMPDCLLELCAHVAAYQSVLKRWENNDFSENLSLVDFPGKALSEYSRRSFQTLKAEQARLTGHKQ